MGVFPEEESGPLTDPLKTTAECRGDEQRQSRSAVKKFTYNIWYKPTSFWSVSRWPSVAPNTLRGGAMGSFALSVPELADMGGDLGGKEEFAHATDATGRGGE